MINVPIPPPGGPLDRFQVRSIMNGATKDFLVQTFKELSC